MTTYSYVNGEDDYCNALYKDDVLVFHGQDDYLCTETLHNVLPKILPEATLKYYNLDSEKCEEFFNNEPYDYPDSFAELLTLTDLTLLTSHEPELV